MTIFDVLKSNLTLQNCLLIMASVVTILTALGSLLKALAPKGSKAAHIADLILAFAIDVTKATEALKKIGAPSPTTGAATGAVLLLLLLPLAGGCKHLFVAPPCSSQAVAPDEVQKIIDALLAPEYATLLDAVNADTRKLVCDVRQVVDQLEQLDVADPGAMAEVERFSITKVTAAKAVDPRLIYLRGEIWLQGHR